MESTLRVTSTHPLGARERRARRSRATRSAIALAQLARRASRPARTLLAQRAQRLHRLGGADELGGTGTSAPSRADAPAPLVTVAVRGLSRENIG